MSSDLSRLRTNKAAQFRSLQLDFQTLKADGHANFFFAPPDLSSTQTAHGGHRAKLHRYMNPRKPIPGVPSDLQDDSSTALPFMLELLSADGRKSLMIPASDKPLTGQSRGPDSGDSSPMTSPVELYLGFTMFHIDPVGTSRPFSKVTFHKTNTGNMGQTRTLALERQGYHGRDARVEGTAILVFEEETTETDCEIAPQSVPPATLPQE